jgi:hypothetical protein
MCHCRLSIFDCRFEKKAERKLSSPPLQLAIGNQQSEIALLVLVYVNILGIDHIIVATAGR